jgi:hypothetical protein
MYFCLQKISFEDFPLLSHAVQEATPSTKRNRVRANYITAHFRLFRRLWIFYRILGCGLAACSPVIFGRLWIFYRILGCGLIFLRVYGIS